MVELPVMYSNNLGGFSAGASPNRHFTRNLNALPGKKAGLRESA
jgi:hypothetical protein